MALNLASLPAATSTPLTKLYTHPFSSSHHFLQALPLPLPLPPPSLQNKGMHVTLKRLRVVFETSQDGVNKPDSLIVSITGATGFIGKKLVRRLISDGHKVRVLTRSSSKANSLFPAKGYPGVEIAEESDWGKCIQGSTAVVNLAGAPISTRWSPEVKADILESRVQTTAKVVDVINSLPKEKRPSVFVSATAVGFYGTSETRTFDESSPSGQDYLSKVCREWESTAQTVNDSVRLVLIRIGIVLDSDGGALARMIPLFKMFAGGPIGSGKQWFSWVHRDDLVNLVVESLSNPSYKGVINGTAPNPVRFSEMFDSLGAVLGVINGTSPNPVRFSDLCSNLGAVLGRPSWLPVPGFVLQVLLGEGASLVLDGQRVLPKRALELGFRFKYCYINDALKASMSS